MTKNLNRSVLVLTNLRISNEFFQRYLCFEPLYIHYCVCTFRSIRNLEHKTCWIVCFILCRRLAGVALQSLAPHKPC